MPYNAIVDTIHTSLECCGLDYPAAKPENAFLPFWKISEVFFETNYPESCCKPNSMKSEELPKAPCDEKHLFIKGCFKRFENNFLQEHKLLLLTLSLTFVICYFIAGLGGFILFLFSR